MKEAIYTGCLKLHGEESEEILTAAINYAGSLLLRSRFEEARSLLRKQIPVARRILGDSNEVTFSIKMNYAVSIFADTRASLDYLHEAVSTLEKVDRAARHVFGSAHPTTVKIETLLRDARATLGTRETPPPGNA